MEATAAKGFDDEGALEKEEEGEQEAAVDIVVNEDGWFRTVSAGCPVSAAVTSESMAESTMKAQARHRGTTCAKMSARTSSQE